MPEVASKPKTIFELAADVTEKKTPVKNAGATWGFLKDTPTPAAEVLKAPVTEATTPPAITTPAPAAPAPTEPVYTKEDYEFSAHNTARMIEEVFKLAGNGTNFAVMKFRMRRLFKGKDPEKYIIELEQKEKDKTITAAEKALLDKGEEIVRKYDLMEKGIPFADQEAKDLERCIMDYQEYTKKPINPRLMIYFTIANIFLKRINIAIFN